MKILNAMLAIALAVALASGLAACNRRSQPKTGDLSPNSGANGENGKVANKLTVKSTS